MKYLIILFCVFSTSIKAQQILLERQRAEVVDNILKDRFDNLLPQLMDGTGF